ncbi:MAG TPA: alpha/beta hydrolase [Deltaproteobacteria bacterium]|nr:alpha/beta hydrolase [Deltaproteobacteria bacterium]HPR55709.1 alpha/beta hydrolase [Deltaproteobacteria bacterium]HXK47344.1 alpha/beta hydrolase [Deltaproteobacteria bacterium]
MKSIAKAVLFLLMAYLMSGCASVKQGMFDFMMSAERSRSDLKPGIVRIQDQSMAYLERPGKGETIVLIHGFTGNKDHWTRFVRYLPEDYRVLAFDMPGHGDNEQSIEKTYTVDYMVSTLDQAVDALGISRFHLAGSSMGGWISILYAARYPQKVRSLCLMDNAGLMNVSPRPSDLQLEVSKGHNPFFITSREDFDELFGYAFHEQPFYPWPIFSVLSDRAIASNTFYEKVGNEFLTRSTDIQPLLPGLEMPVLVIWGDKDRILHVSTTEVLSKSLPRSEIVIMKDCGHMPMVEKPRETAEYYVNFLSRQRLDL